GLKDLRQTWDHLARELAAGVPELPGVIDSELAGLSLTDLNEETLIRVSESVVNRVADAGFPQEATALFRRMGRAMYELLLLLATQQEIREMGIALEDTPSEPPRSAAPAPVPAAVDPPISGKEAWPSADGAEPALPIGPAQAPPSSAAPAPPAEPAPVPRAPSQPPPAKAAAGLAEVVSGAEPRDPVRPTRRRNGAKAPAAAQLPATEMLIQAQPAPPLPTPPASDPLRPAAPAQEVHPVSELRPAPIGQVADLPVTETLASIPPDQPAVGTPLDPLRPARAPAPAMPAPMEVDVPNEPALPAPPPEPVPGPDAAPAAVSPNPASPGAPDPVAPGPGPRPRELSDDEAPLWGFDPAARETGSVEPAPEPAPVLEPAVPVASGANGAARRPELTHRVGWTVRLSPRSSTEQERKLEARAAQLPGLLDEIVAAAQSQQEALSARGSARRALAAAKSMPPLAAGADPGERVQAHLEAKEFEEAARLAVHVALTERGEEAAGLACTVGEGAKQAKQVELAMLCFTTAVVSSPPCDRACWQLCTLSVERRDAAMAPVWLEFVARLLRARAADVDAISVYRQLLNLAPRRDDIRELLRISSLTGVLPD
ncbi:MAG TPA: hypothetical protein VI138_05460, partial [Candidatus Dormibacteraeota bacterium]